LFSLLMVGIQVVVMYNVTMLLMIHALQFATAVDMIYLFAVPCRAEQVGGDGRAGSEALSANEGALSVAMIARGRLDTIYTMMKYLNSPRFSL